MPATSNTLYIMGADARGVVLGARQAEDALVKYGNTTRTVTNKTATASRGLFNSTAQISFALQDVSTVLAMGGGMERALLSAANNISFLASANGTLLGAISGVAITLGAVFVPRLVSATMGARSLADELERVARISDRIQDSGARAARAVEFEQDIRDLPPKWDAERLRRLADMLREAQDAEAQLRADRDTQLELLHEHERAVRVAADRLNEAYEAAGVGINSFVRDDGGPGPGPTFSGVLRGIGISTGDISVWERRLEALRKESDEAHNSMGGLILDMLKAAAETARLTDEFHAAALALAAYNKESERLFGKDRDNDIRKMRERFEKLPSFGPFTAEEKEAEMMRMKDLRVEQAERLRSVHEEILDLMRRQSSLAREGTVEEANIRQRARMQAFDNAAFGLRERDQELRTVLQQLHAALMNGARIMVVR